MNIFGKDEEEPQVTNTKVKNHKLLILKLLAIV